MSTDFGRYALSTPVEGLRQFIACMLDLGIPADDVADHDQDQPGTSPAVVGPVRHGDVVVEPNFVPAATRVLSGDLLNSDCIEPRPGWRLEPRQVGDTSVFLVTDRRGQNPVNPARTDCPACRQSRNPFAPSSCPKHKADGLPAHRETLHLRRWRRGVRNLNSWNNTDEFGIFLLHKPWRARSMVRTCRSGDAIVNMTLSHSQTWETPQLRWPRHFPPRARCCWK